MVGLAMSASATSRQGRPPATDHDAIERAAFALFAERGFEATTIDDIAAAAGVGRRTLFRYYPSKNDIPWGQFDASLVRLRDHLAAMPSDIPVHRAVHDAVLAFNRLDPAAIPQHRQRMRLLLTTPALQAHSVLRYAQWRGTIAAYVASRLRPGRDRPAAPDRSARSRWRSRCPRTSSGVGWRTSRWTGSSTRPWPGCVGYFGRRGT